MSKTPQFDKAIEEILKDLKPHKKDCGQCGSVFNIFREDIDFYKKMKVPPPILCPDCRTQRRLGYRIVQLPIFHKRKCDAPEHSDTLISFYSKNNKVKVYDDDYYLSDSWDALEFGRDYDYDKSFFEQFNELALAVPHQSLFKDPQSVNCDYVVSGVAAKNCYYVAIPYESENIYYGFLPVHSRDCIDISDADYSEQCYGSVHVNRCYNCNFCHECFNCIDCSFMFDCRNCSHCFGCTNLRNKKYCLFNRQLEKNEYKRRISEINLGKRSVLTKYKNKFNVLEKNAIRKCVNNVKAENSFGNDLRECRNCFYAFRVIGNGSENLRYFSYGDNAADEMDVYGSSFTSLIYESAGTQRASNIKLSIMLRGGANLEYCAECRNCDYCFGCFGLRDKKYCIFNKQYSENEYWRIVDRIKSQMLQNKEYGEFFPLSMSWFPYNESDASVEFPLTKDKIIKNGWYWEDEEESDIDLSKFKALKPNEVPDDISDVSDDVLKSVIICEKTGKPFKITKFELDFYRKKNLPLPTIHPLQRIKDRFEFKHPLRIWQYPCSKCGTTMDSGHDPEKKLKVYCEACYLREVV